MDTRRIDIIRLDAVEPQRWFNGAGWTREITRSGDAQDWDWRLSVADVEADGPFSSLPGIEREIFLLQGEGMQFDFEDGEAFALTPETPRLRFDGGRGLQSRLIDGSTRDFNLMWRRGEVDAELWVRPLVGTSVIFVEPDETWAFHLASGEARLDDAMDAPLSAGDTALLTTRDKRASLRVEAAGVALVMRLRPAVVS